MFRPEGFQPTGTGGPAGTLALATLPSGPGAAAEPAEEPEREGVWPSPAQRLSLASDQLARAQKCLAEAIYFESRGETKRGQIAVAQVIVNRVFSGYYPQDVCGTVYQNAHRHLACQFTFACDDVRDVVREPDMWVQAKEIAADMLDGKLWLTSVGRATHYHAYWVHPSWVREMRKLDRIGVHTFYRPRRWGEG
ncbi:cell wall hydrolase [Xanthobacter dioxanivorans]|uniref:Cell wall hydrolase n=1 Tax=Xanthobacter dioxanivorans TaxID=2528964 RepID=A0A974PTG5_9HYPH|nr:cell wall hydrolase [Xanthobacter dioxanivorans]